MLQTTAQRFGSTGKSFVSPSAAAAVIGAALIASGTTDDAETAWSPAAACLLPDILPVAGTLLSYGGDRQLAAGGTVTHSGALSLGSNNLTCSKIVCAPNNGDAALTVGGVTDAGIFNYGSRYLSISGAVVISAPSVTPRVILRPDCGLHWNATTNLEVPSPNLSLHPGGAGILQQRNGLNAQCFLLNKTYTSDSSQEALMLDAGKQISGNLGLYSYRGSAGGSNYPVRVGMLAADGSTFSGLTVGTDGNLTVGAITASGAIQETPTQSSLNPTTTDIPSGKRMGWYNSTLSEFRDWVNIGGTLLKSAAYT